MISIDILGAFDDFSYMVRLDDRTRMEFIDADLYK